MKWKCEKNDLRWLPPAICGPSIGWGSPKCTSSRSAAFQSNVILMLTLVSCFFKLHFPTIIQHKNENADVYCLMLVWWWFPRNVGLLGAVGESLLIICAPSRCRCTLAKCNALQYYNARCIAALLSCSAFCILSLVSTTTILYHLTVEFEFGILAVFT